MQYFHLQTLIKQHPTVFLAKRILRAKAMLNTHNPTNLSIHIRYIPSSVRPSQAKRLKLEVNLLFKFIKMLNHILQSFFAQRLLLREGEVYNFYVQHQAFK